MLSDIIEPFGSFHEDEIVELTVDGTIFSLESWHFKKVGKYRSVRVGRSYRALAVEIEEGLLWLWIGSHAEYDRMVDS